MTTRNLVTALPWGERTALLPKAMVYAFSLDVDAICNGAYMKVGRSTENGLRHLFDQDIVAMPEGIRCDVPAGRIESGDGQLGDPNDPSSCWLQLRIRSLLEDSGATLFFDTKGVVNFEGGPSAFHSKQTRCLAGSAFLSSTQEASTATYRWLERRQLFGVGTVIGERCAPPAAPDAWKLKFSFDLYAAG
jgi:hypothetical protein